MGKVLAILSNYGFWGVEFTSPYLILKEAGFEFDIVTPNGETPIALPPSYDVNFYDPPLGVCVTTPDDASEVQKIISSNVFENVKSLNKWFPTRPYFCREKFLRAWEKYFEDVKAAQKSLAEYDALLLIGGSGPIIDMVNNQRVHDVVLGFYKAQKPIGAICYGVAVLPFARDFNERKCIIEGKHVTGHCLEYDYLDGTGFVGTDLNMGPPPYCLEYVLRDAVGINGMYHGNFGKRTSVVVDYPFITARSLQCSREFGEQMVAVLQQDVKRYGW